MDIINKLDMYSYSYDEVSDMQNLLEIAMFMDTPIDRLDEAIDIKGGLKSLMSKMGLHAHGSGKGLIQMIAKASKVLGEFFWHVFQASLGNEASKKRAKELANTEIKKEDVIDFLLKLDMATLHLITGPLHTIDAITGWHIWAAVGHKAETALKKAKDAIENLKTAAKTVEGKAKEQIKKYIHGIVKLFGLDMDHKAIQAL